MRIQTATDRFSVLANEARLTLFKELVRAERRDGDGGLPAGELATRLSIAPSNLSFHLKEMSRSGLVDSRREGRSIIYRARLDAMNELVDYLLEDCCGGACGVSIASTSS